MKIDIRLGSGKKIIAEFNGYSVVTDQPAVSGGEGSAPTPFELFLASIGTCAGIFVKSFCMQRNISTDKISLTQNMKWNPQTHLVSDIEILINLPEDFPEKYTEAIINAASLCTVKRHFNQPPEINVKVKMS